MSTSAVDDRNALVNSMESAATAVTNEPNNLVLQATGRKTFAIHKLLLDGLIVLCVGIPILVFKVAVPPYHRGFYCNDESLRYPYKPSTISTGVLIGVGVTLPAITILAFELMRLYLERQNQRFYPPAIIYRVGKRNIHRTLVRLYIFVGYLLLGACMSQLLTDICKYAVGRLRPHFISVCDPDWDQVNCTSPTGKGNYILEPHCKSTDEYLKKEARVSFPSGHASFSFYCAIFTVLYLQARVVWPLYRPILRTALQFMFVALAVACSVSRVSDYKHHWSDVFAGAVLGLFVALVTGLYVGKLFARKELAPEQQLRQEMVLLQDVRVTRTPDDSGKVTPEQ